MSGLWDDVRAAIGLDQPRPERARAQRGPKHAPRVPFAVLVVTLMVGGLGSLLLLNTASAANEVHRHDLAARDAGIAAQLQELQNEVAASAAPGNLAQAAAELGMVPAGNPAFLVVGSDGSVKVMGSPKPVSEAAAAIPPKRSPDKPTSSHPSTTSSTDTSSSSATNHAGRTSPNPSRHGRAPGTVTPSTTPSATPTPTPTPTPTVVLPGGNR